MHFCVSNLAATSGYPQFGVCPRLLWSCVHQAGRCSFFFPHYCPGCDSLSLRGGGNACIVLRLCCSRAEAWLNFAMLCASVPRGGWYVPHKFEVCVSLLSEFTSGFLLCLRYLCSCSGFAAVMARLVMVCPLACFISSPSSLRNCAVNFGHYRN